MFISKNSSILASFFVIYDVWATCRRMRRQINHVLSTDNLEPVVFCNLTLNPSVGAVEHRINVNYLSPSPSLYTPHTQITLLSHSQFDQVYLSTHKHIRIFSVTNTNTNFQSHIQTRAQLRFFSTYVWVWIKNNKLNHRGGKTKMSRHILMLESSHKRT